MLHQQQTISTTSSTTSLPSFKELITSIPSLPSTIHNNNNNNNFSSNFSNKVFTDRGSASYPASLSASPTRTHVKPSSLPIYNNRLPTPPISNLSPKLPPQPLTINANTCQVQPPPPYHYGYVYTTNYHPSTQHQNNYNNNNTVSFSSAVNYTLPTPTATVFDSSINSNNTCPPSNYPTTTTSTKKERSSSTGDLQGSKSTYKDQPHNSTFIINKDTLNHKDGKRKHVCKACSRCFTTSGHLARHNRIHTGERKHICPWPTCGAKFARQDNCMQHYKTHTNGKNKRSKNIINNGNNTNYTTKFIMNTLDHAYNSKTLV